MNDGDYESIKKRVQSSFSFWLPIFTNNLWTVTEKWSRTKDEEEPETYAITNALWQYRSATITFFAPAMADLDYERIDDIVRHELSHIMLASLSDNLRDNTETSKERDLATQIVEMATEDIATLIKRVVINYKEGPVQSKE